LKRCARGSLASARTGTCSSTSVDG
jgi:hypothetical protein